MQLGDCGMLPDEQVSEFECVAGCNVRLFQRVPGVGITWPMFDNAVKTVPLPFGSVYVIASNHYQNTGAYYNFKNVIPKPGNTLTHPKLTQLVVVFSTIISLGMSYSYSITTAQG
ncbi:uncharacterized protein EURHEDRAFT_270839 [Aspergillus ruber CBS 135680]|uniref:Uncharacterized protein n=1 Tax=Aspergillus ruber (strain CBS 135680) TaxID=1388766 RepID=A0A017SMW8_ASPRC|nr:uncharacterized protein EURHEDRAFT_270839 [Aspergillus ruber CBS 135680]EYE98131.1 hypothetical protein EURHEDRAFT_270839 [Aspergillus ruber CBS 135680]